MIRIIIYIYSWKLLSLCLTMTWATQCFWFNIKELIFFSISSLFHSFIQACSNSALSFMKDLRLATRFLSRFQTCSIEFRSRLLPDQFRITMFCFANRGFCHWEIWQKTSFCINRVVLIEQWVTWNRW